MKTVHPFLVAMIAGGLAALTTFFMNAGAQDKPDISLSKSYQTAIFAGGCFWCVEADFDKVSGVIETVSGYTGGISASPTYKTHGSEGHLEAVRVVYDPEIVDYARLVDYFVRHIDPTDDGGQFCDRGNSYTTAVFVTDDNERETVSKIFEQLEKTAMLPGPIVTKIRDEAPFHKAETYHQDYYLKNATRYKFYRNGCGRDQRVRDVWSAKTGF